MSARLCFTGKIAAGVVSKRAGEKLVAMLDQFEEAAAKRGERDAAALAAAARDVSLTAKGDAARQADLTSRSIIAQAAILNEVKTANEKLVALRKDGKAPALLAGEDRSATYAALTGFLDTDPHELVSVNNVSKLAESLLGRAHALFADGIASMRSKAVGFKAETVKELDFLRAAFGRGDVAADAKIAINGFWQGEGFLADSYHAAGGALKKRDNYFPNPEYDAAKARALGSERVKQLIRDNVDRDKIIDFATDKPMEDARFDRFLNEAVTSIVAGQHHDVAPSSAFRGTGMLANARDLPRLFQYKSAESWMAVAEAIGAHTSPYAAAVAHLEGMARDTALIRTLGPNPDATLRFMTDVLSREPGARATGADDLAKGGVKQAVRVNEKIASRNAAEIKSLENLYADVSGQNRYPVSTEIARRMSDARSLLVGAQLGSAMLSSLNDPATLLMTARMAGLDAVNIIRWTTDMFREGGEQFAAQTGMIMDTLAHTARSMDKVMGDTVRSGAAAKIGGGVIRASGLRRWTESLKGGFWLGALAQIASERVKPWGELDGVFRDGLARVGITADEWKIFGQAQAYEPRPRAVFLRPQDVAALGGVAAERASEKLAQYVNTWMDYAVIEQTPRVRAIILGDSQPGTITGELRRSLGMYRFFAGGLMYMHGARALARGWDGSRLGHAALSFTTISLLGALSMQAKEIAAGRDPLSLDPRDAKGAAAWGKAILQGGGLGVFGDILAVDQTRYGNSWAATFAGPTAGAVEAVLGDFLLKNVRSAAQGKDTHFLGDAVFTASRYAPGTSLWYGRLAFQRSVVDQLALWADPRTRERFARIEETARKDWGQSYWSRPGRVVPDRLPAFSND